jgi:hypothetical protein
MHFRINIFVILRSILTDKNIIVENVRDSRYSRAAV